MPVDDNAEDLGSRKPRERAVVAGSFLCHAAAFGTTSAVAALVPFFVEHAGMGPTPATAATIAPLVVLLGVSSKAGRVADRRGSLTIALVGVAFGTIGLLMFAIDGVLGAYLLAAVLLGLGASGLFVPSIRQVGLVVDAGRLSGAVAIAAMGAPTGALLVPPLAVLVASRDGVTVAALSLAVIFATTSLVGALMLGRTRVPLPRRVDREIKPADGRPRLLVAALVLGFAYYVPISQLTSIGREVGLSASALAGLAALLGGTNLIGRFVAGRALSSMSDSGGISASSALLGTGVVVMAIGCFASSPLGIALGVLVYGFGSGALVVVLPVAALHRAGRDDPGHALGALYQSMAVGAFVGPIVVSITLTAGLRAASIPILLSGIAAGVVAQSGDGRSKRSETKS